MESFSFIIVSLACVLGLSSIWLLITTIKLSKKNQKSHRQLTVTESDLIRTKELLSQCEKKLAKNQEQHNGSHSHQNELLELRRDNSHFKDELKKTKEDLRIKDNELKRLESVHIDKLYLLTNEKETLLAQLKEIDKLQTNQNVELRQLLEQLQAQEVDIQERAATFEKQSKLNLSKVITLQSKLKFAEVEIEKLNKQLSVPKVSVIDPQVLARWQERAQCAKKMYLLMRQMRELSDNKVESYQEGVIAISEWVLNNTSTPFPIIKENENKADRLLAEAWTAVVAGNYTPAPINYEQNVDVRV